MRMLSRWVRHAPIGLILGTVAGLGTAADGVRGLPPSASLEPSVHVSRADTVGTVFEVDVGTIDVHGITAGGRAWTRIEVAGAGRSGSPGEPLLPVVRRFVEVSAGVQAAVSAEALERRRISLEARNLPRLLEPVQRSRPKCDCPEARAWRFSYKAAAYRGVVGDELVRTDGPYRMRNHRLLLVTVAPFRYMPDGAELEVATRVRVRVDFSGQPTATERSDDRRLASRAFDAFLEPVTVGLNVSTKAAGWADPQPAPIPFLIVCPPQLEDALTPFVDWKRSCGYDVTVVTTETTGETAEEIKSYIAELYDGPKPPVFVLMVGDSPDPLPTFTPFGGGAGGTDLPFVQIDGDLYPDMLIARWPVDDEEQLVALRDKTLAYEQPQAGQLEWLNRALFLAGDDYQYAGVTTHEDVIAELMGPDTPNGAECELWYGDTENPSTAQLIEALNEGRAWAVYSAHSSQMGWAGDPIFRTMHVSQLDNGGVFPIGIGHSCQSNMWANMPDVFGEVVVTEADKGFVSYFGASNFTYWGEDDWLERGFFDALVPGTLTGNASEYDGQRTLAAACYAGLTEVSLRGGNEAYYWPLYNLNGDPTLQPYTRYPDELEVDAPEVMAPVQDEQFTVSVSSSASGPLGGALIGVSQDGVLLGAGRSGVDGAAVFPVAAPPELGDVLVRVTAQNHVPVAMTVQLAGGSKGVVVLDADRVRCDAGLTVRVYDDDLAAEDQIAVPLSASSGGTTVVTLSRVPGDVVAFSGTTSLGSDLAVSDGDTVTATYVDADDGAGGIDIERTATAELDCVGPTISDVQLVADYDRISVTFDTDEPAVGSVAYGTVRPPGGEIFGATPGTEHVLTVPVALRCTEYWLEARATDEVGNTGLATALASVTTPGWRTVLDEPMDTDPGWSIENGTSVNGWAFGVPQGAGGQYGGADPTSGATGQYVFGVNLEGDYDAGLGTDELRLTTPAIDCSDLRTVELTFARWLGVEQPLYDHARVQVSVGGGEWTTVWENQDEVADMEWAFQTVDVSAEAAGHGAVRFRWTLGETDGAWQYCGWNIDDVRVGGEVDCTVPETRRPGSRVGR